MSIPPSPSFLTLPLATSLDYPKRASQHHLPHRHGLRQPAALPFAEARTLAPPSITKISSMTI
jgi:hypothetical protein